MEVQVGNAWRYRAGSGRPTGYLTLCLIIADGTLGRVDGPGMGDDFAAFGLVIGVGRRGPKLWSVGVVRLAHGFDRGVKLLGAGLEVAVGCMRGCGCGIFALMGRRSNPRSFLVEHSKQVAVVVGLVDFVASIQ